MTKDTIQRLREIAGKETTVEAWKKDDPNGLYNPGEHSNYDDCHEAGVEWGRKQLALEILSTAEAKQKPPAPASLDKLQAEIDLVLWNVKHHSANIDKARQLVKEILSHYRPAPSSDEGLREALQEIDWIACQSMKAWDGIDIAKVPEDKARCIASIHGPDRWASYHQCHRKRGHGPEGLYCKTHDPAAIKKREDERSEKWKKRWEIESSPRLIYASTPDLLAELEKRRPCERCANENLSLGLAMCGECIWSGIVERKDNFKPTEGGR